MWRVIGFIGVLWALTTAQLTWAFPGGVDLLLQESRQWIAHEIGQPTDAIDIVRPDERAVVRPCETPLQFRFPFRGNQRTLEVTCERPNWKFFLRTDVVPTETVVVVTQAVNTGDLLQEEWLALRPAARPPADALTDLAEATGQRVTTNLAAGSPLRRNDLTAVLQWFQLNEAVSRDAPITRDMVRSGTSTRADLPRDLVLTWPAEGEVFATRDLAAGETLRRADIDTSVTVFVAKDTLVRGTVLAQSQLEQRVLASRQVPQSAISRMETAVGMQTVRTIRAGDLVLTTDLMAADLVRKGEAVTLSIRQGALTITVSTLALSDAKMGEQVSLQNPESGKVILGIVTGRHQARGL